jgi:hypothetical protein
MEYLGILVKNEYISEVLFDYFGETIINSYNKLEPILSIDKKRRIEETKDTNKKEQKLSDTYFIHYRRLYDMAVKRKQKFEKECKNYFN